MIIESHSYHIFASRIHQLIQRLRPNLERVEKHAMAQYEIYLQAKKKGKKTL